MKRRLTAIILAAALAFALCGCGSAFEKEYEAVSDYVPTVQASPYTGDKVTVRSFGSLKQAISEFVLRGETTGKYSTRPTTGTRPRIWPAPAGRYARRTPSAHTAWRIWPMS